METRKVLVVGAKRYSFTDRESNRQVEGTKVHYLDLETLKENDSAGMIPASVNLEYGEFSKFEQLPAVYELEFGFTLKNGKPVVKVTGMEYSSQAEIVI